MIAYQIACLVFLLALWLLVRSTREPAPRDGRATMDKSLQKSKGGSGPGFIIGACIGGALLDFKKAIKKAGDAAAKTGGIMRKQVPKRMWDTDKNEIIGVPSLHIEGELEDVRVSPEFESLWGDMQLDPRIPGALLSPNCPYCKCIIRAGENHHDRTCRDNPDNIKRG